jgi:hypothetical protein
MTLVYCMWHDSSNSSGFKSVNALTDCSIILYVMTERWPAGIKYRDLFESVKKSVLDAIAEGKHFPRTAVSSMKEGMQTTLQSLQVDNTTEHIRDDLEQMISDMTGEEVSFWDEVDMEFAINAEAELAGLGNENMEGLEDVDVSQVLSPTGARWGPTDSSLWFDSGEAEREYNNHIEI